MSRAWDKEKNLSLQQDSNLWPHKQRASTLSTGQRRTHGERDHILSSYLTCVLQTARISNVKIILYGFRFARISNVEFVLYGEEWKMVNFKLGEQMWRWNNQHVTSVGQRKKSESSTGFEPMTSQTPDVRSTTKL